MSCRTLTLRVLFILAAAPVCAQGAQSFAAKVVQVKDGDSVVLRANRVEYDARLGEIDAPEYDQAWGKSARKALNRLVKRKQVNVTVQDIDSYGRFVVQLRLRDASVNARLVADGHAWAYRDYLRDPKLLELETQARQQGRGLWA